MKRNFKIIKVAILLLIIPFFAIQAQDKKNEQKIKIIVKDGSNTKVIIDTVFNGDHGPDSLILKDGSVVQMKHHGGEGNNHIFVMSTDNKDGSDITREMTVITSDSMDLNDDHGNVMYYENDNDGHHRYKVITRSSDEGVDNESDPDLDKTRFVIAKDGMVVTIEGSDEAKAKELAKEIEKKLGVTGKDDEKEVTKSKSEKKINK